MAVSLGVHAQTDASLEVPAQSYYNRLYNVRGWSCADARVKKIALGQVRVNTAFLVRSRFKTRRGASHPLPSACVAFVSGRQN
jgi:hypothetical protein